MQYKVFSIRDIKAEVFLPPFCIPSTKAAIRFFGDLLKDPNSVYSKHPEDYSLYELGVYSDSMGTFELYSDNLKVASNLDCV